MYKLDIIQNNSSSSIKDFGVACDELSTAKYILAEAKISKVLKTIVVNSKLYTLMGQVCNGFDLIAILDNHRAKNEDGFDTILPPQEAPTCVGMVFRLLYKLDTEKSNEGSKEILKDFLSKYYNSQDLNASMLEFGLLISVFKQKALQLLAG
ncbi:MAG: hypothetical protein FWF56_05820 [Firmicutes bacterium]|nr:hypothetical protein [Bacillota bacterium]MCL1953496.1 hypothetical protein [Bacillota bacterium]